MKILKIAGALLAVLGMSFAAPKSAWASDASDGVFDENVPLTSVTKVGYRAGYSTISVVITGTDSSGNAVTLSMMNT